MEPGIAGVRRPPTGRAHAGHQQLRQEIAVVGRPCPAVLLRLARSAPAQFRLLGHYPQACSCSIPLGGTLLPKAPRTQHGRNMVLKAPVKSVSYAFRADTLSAS